MDSDEAVQKFTQVRKELNNDTVMLKGIIGFIENLKNKGFCGGDSDRQTWFVFHRLFANKDSSIKEAKEILLGFAGRTDP